MTAQEYDTAKDTIIQREVRCRKDVLNNLALLLYRVKHRFTIEELQEIDRQFKRVNIEI